MQLNFNLYPDTLVNYNCEKKNQLFQLMMDDHKIREKNSSKQKGAKQKQKRKCMK